MIDFHSLIVNRRSIRRYSDELISPEQVKSIIEAGLLAPTSKNTRSWQFIAVDNKEMLEKLSLCKPQYATSIKDCKLAVVVCGDQTKSDVWIEDASIAATYMQLQAQALGLGSCWIQVRGRFTGEDIPSDEYVAEQLSIPEEFPVLCILTFGKKAEERKPNDTEKLKWENVHIGAW